MGQAASRVYGALVKRPLQRYYMEFEGTVSRFNMRPGGGQRNPKTINLTVVVTECNE